MACENENAVNANFMLISKIIHRVCTEYKSDEFIHAKIHKYKVGRYIVRLHQSTIIEKCKLNEMLISVLANKLKMYFPFSENKAIKFGMIDRD